MKYFDMLLVSRKFETCSYQAESYHAEKRKKLISSYTKMTVVEYRPFGSLT